MPHDNVKTTQITPSDDPSTTIQHTTIDDGMSTTTQATTPENPSTTTLATTPEILSTTTKETPDGPSETTEKTTTTPYTLEAVSFTATTVTRMSSQKIVIGKQHFFISLIKQEQTTKP